MLRSALAATLIFSVSGCMSYKPIGTPPQKVAFSSETARVNVHKYSSTAIRTVREEGSKEIEVKGASCMITGTGYSARITTPALVELPTYHGKTDPVSVACWTPQRSAYKSVDPYNETLQRIRSTQSSTGGWAGVIGTAIGKGLATSLRNPAKDEFAYRTPIEMTLTVSE